MMRKILLLILMLSFFKFCFADVTAEILGKEIDANGNILIKTQYKIDSVEVPSRYPQENGKYYWVTRYSIQNFANMDATQIQAKIDADLNAFSESLITKPFLEQQRTALKDANTTLLSSDLLKNVVGHKVTTASAKLNIDSNFDGIEDKELTVKTDGSKIEKDITITPVIE